jgi:hypothetical protein
MKVPESKLSWFHLQQYRNKKNWVFFFLVDNRKILRELAFLTVNY